MISGMMGQELIWEISPSRSILYVYMYRKRKVDKITSITTITFQMYTRLHRTCTAPTRLLNTLFATRPPARLLSPSRRCPTKLETLSCDGTDPFSTKSWLYYCSATDSPCSSAHSGHVLMNHCLAPEVRCERISKKVMTMVEDSLTSLRIGRTKFPVIRNRDQRVE